MTVHTAAHKPLLRGYLHLGMAVAAQPGVVLLVLRAGTAREYLAAAVFAASLVLLYAVSAVYHVVAWGPGVRAVLQRLDHSMIFVLIAGTYTPLCLLVLDATWGLSMLATVWGLAAAGTVLKAFWPDARWLGVSFYLILGWLALLPTGELLEWFSAPPLMLLFGGGLMYSTGAVVYALQRPDPFPRVYGYHEIFHTFVILGTVLHYALIAGFVLA